jgi:hypothetical protein
MDYLDNDTAAGVYTLPAASIEKMAKDFVYKLGDGTPNALYSKEVSFSLIADVVPRRYGGVGASSAPGVFPYRFVYNGWSLEGSISKPLTVDGNTLKRDFFTGGGDTGLEQLFYVYSTSLADYSTALDTDGQMRFTLNIKFDSVTLGFDDETVENLTFKGLEDGTNNIFMVEQMTTASQTWAT